ncbi:DUF1427 family protein [Acidisarcina polymorpha]|uniref:DUF1427 family protein n=1 Tax=Acidisarcina polymorpha TaxID=2211140 RepID=UPI000DEF55D9|nr:DUF1427 family protein [Acidisarcina polymorpha]
MKLIIGMVLSFMVGAGCRYFDIPVPSPPLIPGALLVLAMTIGYSATNRILDGQGKFASTTHLCGGPTGMSGLEAKSGYRANATNSNVEGHDGV